jgi:SAM-dependent methyltransferase
MGKPSTSQYYDDYWRRGHYPEGSGQNPRVLELIDSELTAQTRCIDVGCGNGKATGVWLADRVGQYIGVDVSPVAIEEARALGLDARLIEDATSLPFADQSFDLAVCVEVLEHLVHPDQAVTEIARVLSPTGVLIATVPNTVFWRRRVDAVVGRWNPFGDDLSVSEPWRDPHLRFFTARSLGAMIAGCGFEDVHISGHDGAVLRNIPLVRDLGRGGVSKLYGRLESRMPSLLAERINCVARKAGGVDQTRSAARPNS